MTYQVRTHQLVPADWPIEWCDAELCAALCRPGRRIHWDTVRFERLPSTAHPRYAVIMVTATASA